MKKILREQGSLYALREQNKVQNKHVRGWCYDPHNFSKSCESNGKQEARQAFIASQSKDESLALMELVPSEHDYLIEGDCLEVLTHVPDDSIDMVLCDLPYGTTQNKWDSVIDLDSLWKQYRRVVKNNGAIVLTSQGIFTAKLILSNEKEFKYKIVWEKSKSTNFLNAKKQPLRKHEDICVFYRRQPVYNPEMGTGSAYNKGTRKNQLSGSYGDFGPIEVMSEGTRYPTDVVYFKTAESEGKVVHPTQKPVALGRYLIRTYSNPGDVVLDNASGSGSFLLAARQEGRKFIGIEKNQNGQMFRKEPADYIDLTLKRLADMSENSAEISVETIRRFQ